MLVLFVRVAIILECSGESLTNIRLKIRHVLVALSLAGLLFSFLYL